MVTIRSSRLIGLIGALTSVLLLAAPWASAGQQSASPPAKAPAAKSPAKPPAAKKPAAAKPPARSSAAFDKLVQEAHAAREATRLDEAITLYGKAVAQRPDWLEGHWYLGLSYYDLDRYELCRDSFRRITQRDPKNGGGWSFKGLCEFRLKNYDIALEDLIKGRSLGLPQQRDVVSVSRYHIAALLNRMEEYEESQRILHEFVLEGDDSPRIIELLGIAALRLPVLPGELPAGRREQIMMAGRAAYFAAARMSTAARPAFEELLRRYPETPNVHYAYGLFLINEHPDEALEQFREELKVSPRHPWAKLQMAFEYIKRAEWEEGQRWAQEAVTEAPNLFVARKALGQILLETGDIENAIKELEAGVRIAPHSPTLRFTLARAYRRAGRSTDAEREQAEFTRLSRSLRRERGGPQAVGGIDLDNKAPVDEGTP